MNIKNYIDCFIRSEYVQNWISEKEGDFINESERASRCHDAAEYGAGGSTHGEIIDDWREAFDAMIQDRKAWNAPERFCAKVHAYFDELELWHERNGSLHQELG